MSGFIEMVRRLEASNPTGRYSETEMELGRVFACQLVDAVRNGAGPDFLFFSLALAGKSGDVAFRGYLRELQAAIAEGRA